MKFGQISRIERAQRLPLLLTLLAGLSVAQSIGSGQKATDKPGASWHDDKFTVRVDAPYISKGGLLVLAYTVTNHSGSDHLIYREGEGKPDDILKGGEEVKLFRRTRTSGDYNEIAEGDNSVAFFRTSLPVDVPIHLLVAFQIPKDEESWWSTKKELTPRQAIERILPDTDAIVVLFVPGPLHIVPTERLRIVLPVKSAP
ncbi:MAG: hypothetical protein ABSD63_14420 [Candidatus Korobacteraceae bacterium]